MTKHCGLFSPLFRLPNALILSDETFFIRIFCPPPVTFGPSRLYWRVKGAGAHDEHTGLEPMSQRDVTRLPVYPFTSLLVYRVARLLLHGFTRLLVHSSTSLLVYRIARLLLHGFTCLLVHSFTRPSPFPIHSPLKFQPYVNLPRYSPQEHQDRRHPLLPATRHRSG